MGAVFKLNDEQHAKAKEILLSCRKKRDCGKCYERGYTGILEDRSLIPCSKCTDVDEVMKQWKEYCSAVPELREYYHDLFKEDKESQEPER